MNRSSVVAGAFLVFAGSAATAAPFPVVRADTAALPPALENVQYYSVSPYGAAYVPPPSLPPVYFVPSYRKRPSAPAYGYEDLDPYDLYDKKTAKDAIKAQRRMQKEILKDQARAWKRGRHF